MQNLGYDDRCQVRLNFFVGYALEEAFGISGCARDVIEKDVGVNQARRIRRKQLNIHRILRPRPVVQVRLDPDP